MKKFIISEEEKNQILGLHKSFVLNEQEQTTTTTTAKPIDYKIQDIQALVNVNTDNILGPKTLEAINKKIEEIKAKKAEEVKTTEVEKTKETETQKQDRLVKVKGEFDKLKANNFGDTEIKDYLKDLGFTDEEIGSVISGTSEQTPNKQVEKSVEKSTETTPFDKMGQKPNLLDLG